MWKWKNATHFKLLYIKDGVLLVRYRRNRKSQFVAVLMSGFKLLHTQADLCNFIFTDDATAPCSCMPYRSIPLALSPLGGSGQ